MRSIVAALMLCLACTGSMATEVMVGMASVDNGRATKFDGGHYGGRIATGDRFKTAALGVAHRTLPLNSCLMIQYGARAQKVVINDRGPCATAFCRQHAPARVRNRVIDMTPGVATQLKFPGLGTVSYWPVPCGA